MDIGKQAIARACLEAAESDAMTFPQIAAALMAEGFEGYALDFRRATMICYLPDGDSVVLGTHGAGAPVAPAFDAASVQGAIREAQQQMPGYTYKGFCARVAAAGCAGYIVSFLGRRVVYLGRTAEAHVELFPV